MAVFKLICNTDAKLFVDQVFLTELQENKLCTTELPAGMYLVDVVSLIDDQIQVSFELSFENDNQQILKRIDLAEEEKKSKQKELKSELMRNPNLSFYRNLARFEYNGLWGYVDNNYEIVVEPIYFSAEDFVNDFALVGKSFSEGTKYALVDTSGKNRMGIWFDDLIFRDEKRLFVRRKNDLLSYDVSKGTLFTYTLSGEIKDDDLIPVLWENNYSKKGGYINLRGEVVLPFIYDSVTNFSEDGLAEVERFGFKRFINRKGEICLYNTVYDIIHNDNKDTGKLRYTLDKEFDWCGPIETSHGDSLFLYRTLRMAVKKGDKWGYYSFWKNEVKNCLEEMLPCKYDAPLSDSIFNFVIMRDRKDCCIVNLLSINYKGGEKDGQSVYGPVGAEMFRIEADNIYPIIEREPHYIPEDPWRGISEMTLYLFHFKKIVIQKNGKFGIIDKNTREFILSCEYDDIYSIGKDKTKSHVFYSNNEYIVEKAGFKEIINNEGKIISDISAIDLFPIRNFWAIKTSATKNRYCLYSLTKGIIDILFDDIYPSNWGHSECIIKRDGKIGVVSYNGELIIDCLYDRIKGNYNDQFHVYLGNKCGFYKNSEKVLDCLYDSIKEFGWNDLLVVELNGKKALYYDHRLTGFNYDDIQLKAITLYDEEEYDNYHDDEYFEFDDSGYGYSYVILVTLDNKKGLLDKEGKMLLDFVFDSIIVDYRVPANKQVFVFSQYGDEDYDNVFVIKD